MRKRHALGGKKHNLASFVVHMIYQASKLSRNIATNERARSEKREESKWMFLEHVFVTVCFISLLVEQTASRKVEITVELRVCKDNRQLITLG